MPDPSPDIPVARMAVIPYAGRAHTLAQGLAPQNLALALAMVLAWSAAGVVVLAGLLGIVWLFTNQVLAGAAPVLGVLLLISVAMFFRGLRRARAVAALNYVEQAVRLNLPLPPMLRAAEAAEAGRFRRKLGKLREHLEDGYSLAAALDRAVPGLPPRAISLVATAERNGKVAATLARLVEELRRKPQSHSDASSGILIRWYPIVLILGLTTTLSFSAIFVMPKFQQIFQDFGIELPRVTIWTMELWAWWGPPLGVTMAAVALVVSGQMLAEAVAPRQKWGDRGPHVGPVTYVADWVTWWLPVARAVARNRGLADVFHTLADAAAAGRPMDAALHEASRLRINVVLRRQVTHWGSQVVEGLSLAEAARKAGMPDVVCGMLAPASAAGGGAGGSRAAGDVEGVFAFLARYYDGRFSRAAALARGALVPAMVLVFAAFVAAAALGIFLPLVELSDRIGNLSGFN